MRIIFLVLIALIGFAATASATTVPITLLSSAGGSGCGSPTSPTNLVFYYTMDTGTISIGGQTVTDSSGNGYTAAMIGTFTSGAEVTGQIAGGLAFNGSTQYLEYSTNVTFFTTGLTYTAWVKVSGYTQYSTIISGYNLNTETGF